MKNTNDHVIRHVRDGFFVRNGEKREKCCYSEIFLLEASGCYCSIYRKNKPVLMVSCPLGVVEEYLPEELFIRVHRSYIVNLFCVEGFIGKAMCVGKKIVPVGALYREEVFACFDFLVPPRGMKK